MIYKLMLVNDDLLIKIVPSTLLPCYLFIIFQGSSSNIGTQGNRAATYVSRLLKNLDFLFDWCGGALVDLISTLLG